MNKREASLIADALIQHSAFRQLITEAVKSAVQTASDTLLTTLQAAQLLGVSTDRVRHLAKHLPHQTVNGRNMFSKAGLIHYMQHGVETI